MAGEWGRVSCRRQWARAGGTFPTALPQVTLLAWGGWTGRPPEAPSSLGGAVGASAGSCHRCLSRAEGSWAQGGEFGLASPQGLPWGRAAGPGVPGSCVTPVRSARP